MRSRERFLSHWKGRLLHSGIHILSHLRLLLRWVFYSVLMGVLVGFIGIAFVCHTVGDDIPDGALVDSADTPRRRSADRVAVPHQSRPE